MPLLTPGESIAAANYLGDAVTNEILQGHGLSSAPALLLERLALAYASAILDGIETTPEPVTIAGAENAYRVTFYDHRENLTLCPFCLCELYLHGAHNVEQIPAAEISGKCSECAFTLGAPTYIAPSLATRMPVILAEIETGLRSGVEL